MSKQVELSNSERIVKLMKERDAARKIAIEHGIMVNAMDEHIAALEKERDTFLRIATESKAIIEGIQKKLGVFTTTEALQRIDELLDIARTAGER